MTDTKVHIAGPDHVQNPRDHGLVIYAEWHCKGDHGEPFTMRQTLDYADTLALALDLKARWTDALS